MAILAMKRITICGLKKDSKAILETIQRLGVIEIQDFTPEDEVFKKKPMPISGAEFERNIHDAENAIEVLNTYNEEKSGILSSFKGRAVISREDYDNFHTELSSVKSTMSRILALSKDVAEKKAEIVKCNQQLDMLVPWEGLDIPLDLSGTEKTSVFIGALPGDWTLDAIYEAMAENLPVDVTIISHDKNQTCIMLICEKAAHDSVNSALRGIGFAYPSVSCSATPSEQKVLLQQEIEKLEEQIKTCEEEIVSYDDQRPKIKFLADYQKIREEKYAVATSLPQSEHAFVMSGYIPEKYIPDLENALADYAVTVETSDLEEGEEAPVLLKNNAFSSSVQGVVESYALPAKGEIDPSFIISLFYFIFFGFMLSDAADEELRNGIECEL